MFPGQWNSSQCYHFAPKRGLLAGAHESICLAFWKMPFSCVLVKIWPKLLERQKNKMEHSCILPGFGDICSEHFLPRLQNYQISSNRLGNGAERWAAISERTFVIYCQWLESTFPETGENVIFAEKFIFCSILSLSKTLAVSLISCQSS